MTKSLEGRTSVRILIGGHKDSTWTSCLWQPKGSTFARLLEAHPEFQINLFTSSLGGRIVAVMSKILHLWKTVSETRSYTPSTHRDIQVTELIIVPWCGLRKSPTVSDIGRTPSTNLNTAVVLYQTTHVKH